MEIYKLIDPGLREVFFWLAAALLVCATAAVAGEPAEKDRLTRPTGELEITFLGHASLILSAGGTVVHVDPYSRIADYAALPKADVVLITHEHQDHLDLAALQAIRKKTTRVITSPAVGERIKDATVMENGARATVDEIIVESVPAYNIKHERSPGVPFHPKGRGNGYIVTMAGIRVYIAGDTENIPEMKNLAGVDVAFLPMNIPYTMTPEMTADAARMIGPRILYPYHFGETDTSRLIALLRDRSDIEVRIRRMP